MGDSSDPFMRGPNAAVQGRPKVVNRANVLQLKAIGQSHPTGLTNNLLKLFEPRPPLEYKSPPEKRILPPYSGIARFVCEFAKPGDKEYCPPVKTAETPAERRARIHQLRLEKGAEMAAEGLKNYDPNNDPNVSGDPYKTLFVARLNYETSESRVKREFESYGPIKRVRLVTEKDSNKPRGYAFIEYMHTRDMKAAYKQADGKKIDGKRVLVDVERGRTVPNWRPRRLGGGLGTTRIGGDDTNPREQVQSAPSRSEEPRAREKSRERTREREKSRERSHDRPRDRDRVDRHHKERERTRDKERERDRGRDRGHDRGRDRGRDYERDRERDRHPREKDRGRDYEAGEHRRDRGRSRDKEELEPDYERNYDPAEAYDPMDALGDHDRYKQYDRDHDRYDGGMEEDYRYDYDREKSRDPEHDYRLSREYDH